jgi:N-acyl-D-aspartate/D-glutamate deacylase/dipeptidyl aminopeptidase/acylaminoacyl peptidase
MRKTRLFALLFALLSVLSAARFALTSAQQTNAGFTVEQILSAPFPSDLIAAPTGERIAWVFNAEGKRNVWGAEGPDFKARQLTAYNEDDGQELTNLGFTRDGKWIVYVRGGDENQAGEVPNPTSDPNGAEQAIYAVNYDDRRVVKVTDGSDPVVSSVDNNVVFSRNNQIWINVIGADVKRALPLFIARGSNGSPQWSPDGKQLAFVSSRGDHSFVGIYDLATEKLRYLAPTIDRDSYPRWSPDGKRIAFVRQPTRGLRPRSLLEDQADPWAIWVADVVSGKAREVWRSGNALTDSLPRTAGADVLQWGRSKDDDVIIFASEKDGWLRLYLRYLGSSGEGEPASSPGAEVEHITLTPDKREIIFSSNGADIDRRALWRSPVGEAKSDAFTTIQKISWSPVVTGDDQYIAYLNSDERQPGMLRVMPLKGGEGKTIAIDSFPKNFPTSQLVKPQPAIFKAADGQEIHGQLFLPPNARPGDKLPAVIFSHGGPVRQMLLGWHYMYYYHNTYAFNQYLANKGYAVLSVNFRSGIGYGRAFREAPKRGARGASEYQDIVAAAHYLRARPDIDANRIGLWGGSYGGYLTALGLARNSDLFACGVDIHGVHDWSTRISGANWIEYGNRDAAKIAFEASPMSAVEKWRAPVLLIHGDDDRSVAFSQTTELARRLREQKVEFEQLVFPDEVHDFLLHRHWVEIFNTAFDFFERRLKNAKPRQTGSHINLNKQVQPVTTTAVFSPRSGRQNKAQGGAQSAEPWGTHPTIHQAREAGDRPEFGKPNHAVARLRGLNVQTERSGSLRQSYAVPAARKAAAPLQQNARPNSRQVDLLIRNGRILDGSGATEFNADLGIVGDRIAFIGDALKSNIKAAKTIDAKGLIVAPGFIDPHTHADEDLSNAQRKGNVNYLMQGVTTVIIGNDGRSPLPISKRLDQLQTQGVGTNVVMLVGHGSVRGAVLGASDATPTAEQLGKMKELVRQAMDDGAFGMSTGLYYAPGSFAKTEEVIELAKVVAERSGIYDTHMRDESSYNIGLLGSIEETIRIGREARLPVHISHIKALGVDVWGQSKQAIALIEKARREGVNVTANQYPYTASGTSLTAALVPRWAEAGGNAELLKRIDDPQVRPKLIAEMEANLKRRGGANSLLITGGRNRQLSGKRLDAIAKAANKSPVEAALDIIKTGGAGVASFNMNEQDIEAFMRQPWVMTGSDGSAGHPRKYGTYARKLNEYVMKRGVITLPRMIQASAQQVAETFGVKGRGKLSEGYFADVIVFDEKAVTETATYEQPEQLAAGMKFVVVNGKLAVEEGKYTGALTGRALRKTARGE